MPWRQENSDHGGERIAARRRAWIFPDEKMDVIEKEEGGQRDWCVAKNETWYGTEILNLWGSFGVGSQRRCGMLSGRPRTTYQSGNLFSDRMPDECGKLAE